MAVRRAGGPRRPVEAEMVRNTQSAQKAASAELVKSMTDEVVRLDQDGALAWSEPESGFAQEQFVRVPLYEEAFCDGMRYTALVPTEEMVRADGPRTYYVERAGGFANVVDVAMVEKA